MPKTFAIHKSTYLYLAITIFYRILPLNDVSVVRFGDIGSTEINHLRSRPQVAGIQQLFSRSAIKQENPHLGKPDFLMACRYRLTKKTPKTKPKAIKCLRVSEKSGCAAKSCAKKSTRPRRLAYLPTSSPSPSVFWDAPCFGGCFCALGGCFLLFAR